MEVKVQISAVLVVLVAGLVVGVVVRPGSEGPAAVVAGGEAAGVGVSVGSFVAVSVGYGHVCALGFDGVVVCWGDNGHGQAEAPPGRFAAVAAGAWHSCGVRLDGAVVCWGSGGQRSVDPLGGEFAAVSVGAWHSCGLRVDGSAVCWGDNSYGQAEAPAGQFVGIVAGWAQSCALEVDGALVCWGGGEGAAVEAPNGTFAAVDAQTAGDTFDEGWCALRVDGSATCWPARWLDAPRASLTAISVGWEHACGLRPDGGIVCWGTNSFGQLDAPGGHFAAVSAGGRQSCGLRVDGTIWCWGRTYTAPVAEGSDAAVAAPDGVYRPSGDTAWVAGPLAEEIPATFSAVDAGWEHTCALRAGNTVVCWPQSYHAQGGVWTLPVNSPEYRTKRVVAMPAGLFTAVSGGGEHSCGLRTDATVACWGHNNYGQANPPRGRFVAVAAGGWHSCALRDDNTVECWGLSKIGAHGDGTRSGSSGGACFVRSPDTTYCWRSAGYEPDGTFSAISAGAIHTCGLRLDDTIDCWGHGAAGRIDAPGKGWPVIPLSLRRDQLEGDSAEESPRSLRWTLLAYEPMLCEPLLLTSAFFCSVQGDVGQADPPGGTYSAVAAGGWHTCALRSDNTLTCWGNNTFGQADPPEGTYIAVAAGWAHTCALGADNTLTCWGDNTHGQTSPPPGDYTNLTAGGTHTCALRADQTIICWGTAGHPQPPHGVQWN